MDGPPTRDDEGAIHYDTRRYVPVQPTPAEDPYTALIRSIRAADMGNAVYDVTAKVNNAKRDCPPQGGKRLALAVGIKHSMGARVEGDAEAFTVDWHDVPDQDDAVFTYRRRAERATEQQHVPSATSRASAPARRGASLAGLPKVMGAKAL
ncbi:hypothetical protein ACWIG5_35005 [Streptomyces lydicus]